MELKKERGEKEALLKRLEEEQSTLMDRVTKLQQQMEEKDRARQQPLVSLMPGAGGGPNSTVSSLSLQGKYSSVSVSFKDPRRPVAADASAEVKGSVSVSMVD